MSLFLCQQEVDVLRCLLMVCAACKEMPLYVIGSFMGADHKPLRRKNLPHFLKGIPMPHGLP